MYQQIVVIGRLGRDAEMKFMPSGEATLQFSLASDRTYNDKAGTRIKETTWFRCQLFGKGAQALNDYLTKGTMVLVEGRLRIDTKTGGPNIWKRQDGAHAAAFEIVVGTVRLLGGGSREAQNEAGNTSPAVAIANDDMPF
jgi:single-strand DNA-binding protein